MSSLSAMSDPVSYEPVALSADDDDCNSRAHCCDDHSQTVMTRGYMSCKSTKHDP